MKTFTGELDVRELKPEIENKYLRYLYKFWVLLVAMVMVFVNAFGLILLVVMNVLVLVLFVVPFILSRIF